MARDRQVLAERLQLAFRLHADGVRLMRQNLRRRHPEAGEDEIQRRLDAWLSDHPLDEGASRPRA